MKVGDLVKIRTLKGVKWQTYPNMENIVEEVGLVIEVANAACKVLFPSLGGNIRSFLESSLEVVDEN